jgi:hypothetical protein
LRSSSFNLLGLPRCSLSLLLECKLASFCRLLPLNRLVFDIGHILSSALPVRIED